MAHPANVDLIRLGVSIGDNSRSEIIDVADIMTLREGVASVTRLNARCLVAQAIPLESCELQFQLFRQNFNFKRLRVRTDVGAPLSGFAPLMRCLMGMCDVDTNPYQRCFP